jgi:hypothetical protein
MSERESQQPQRYCGNCGTELRPGTQFCTSCGTPLAQEQGDNSPAYSEPPTSASSDARRETLWESTRRLADVDSVLGGATIRDIPKRIVNWFRDLSSVVRMVFAGMVLLWLVALVSPLGQGIAVIAFLVSIGVFVVQAIQRKPFWGWAIVTVTALVLIPVFGGISNGIYSGSAMGRDKSGSGNELVSSANNSESLDSKWSSVSSEERKYIEQSISIADETAVLVNRQIALNDQCGRSCFMSETARAETQENFGRMKELSRDASQLRPPRGYEESHKAFLNSWEKRYQLLNYLQMGNHGSTYLDGLALDGNNYQEQAFELAPPKAQRIYLSEF